MITGIHAIFYTKHSKEMYDFLKDALDLRYVDAGNGRLFFAAPPTELAVHETEGATSTFTDLVALDEESFSSGTI